MILVELAGAQGVGKSTLAPLLGQKLREELGQEAVAVLPERDMPRRLRRWTRVQRWRWLLLHPSVYFLAHRLAKKRPHSSAYSHWIRIFSVMGIARQLTRNRLKVVLVDQGLLRITKHADDAAALPSDLLPDLVLQIVADPLVLELRCIYRSKQQHTRYSGEERYRKVMELRKKLQTLPNSELRDALIKYGERYCEPPLTESDVEQLMHLEVTPGPAAMTIAPTQPQRCQPEVRELLQKRGVTWLEIDNSQNDEMKQALAHCMTAIREKLTTSLT